MEPRFRGHLHGISEQLEWFIALAFKSAHALYKQLGGDCDADFSALAQPGEHRSPGTPQLSDTLTCAAGFLSISG